MSVEVEFCHQINLETNLGKRISLDIQRWCWSLEWMMRDGICTVIRNRMGLIILCGEVTSRAYYPGGDLGHTCLSPSTSQGLAGVRRPYLRLSPWSAHS